MSDGPAGEDFGGGGPSVEGPDAAPGGAPVGADLDDGGDVAVSDDNRGNRVAGATSLAVLDYLARSIVDEPDAVVIDVEEGRHAVTLRLHVAPDDMGKIIGRRGRVAQAIRTVVRAASARDDVAVSVDIVD